MHFGAGRLPLGRCDVLDGERVATQFLFLGPFLAPLDTVYAIGSFSKARVFQVRRSMKSIALAYLRWVIAPLVVFITFIAASGPKAGPPELTRNAELTLAIMGLVWAAHCMVAGRTWG